MTNALHHSLNQNVMEGEQQVMSAYEAAFRKIKEATGVGDVNEVIQKFVTQRDTEKQLMNATKEAQARIDALAEERNVMKQQVDEMKFSGAGGQSSRKEVEECEKKLSDAMQGQDRVKTRHGRLTKTFVDIRAGIEHMSDKLEPVKLDQPAVPVSDDTIVDVMLQCDQKLMKMFAVVGDLDDEPDMMSPSRGSTRQGRERGAASGCRGRRGKYNVRVALEEVDDVLGGDDDDDELEGMEPGVLGREEMKKSAANMLDKATSKKGKKKKAGKFAGDKNSAPGGEARIVMKRAERSGGTRSGALSGGDEETCVTLTRDKAHRIALIEALSEIRAR